MDEAEFVSNPKFTRRSVLAGAGAFAASAVAGSGALAGNGNDPFAAFKSGEDLAFNYAPHVGLDSMEDGMFAHHAGPDIVDQLRFMHELGFRAFEDNFMKLRPVEEQRRIAREIERLDMQLATFVASFETTGPKGQPLRQDALTFASSARDDRDHLKAMIGESVEVAKRLNATWCTVLSGRSMPNVPRDYQTANVIENLRHVADIAASAGLTLGLEPINARDWTGTFVTTAPHGHLIVQAVGHPNVRLIYDTYHAQIETGSLIENMGLAWPSIGYIQLADAPGRLEPGTGEINYTNVLRHLKMKGFDGFVGLEHGNSITGRNGEIAVLRALQAVDPTAIRE